MKYEVPNWHMTECASIFRETNGCTATHSRTHEEFGDVARNDVPEASTKRAYVPNQASEISGSSYGDVWLEVHFQHYECVARLPPFTSSLSEMQHYSNY